MIFKLLDDEKITEQPYISKICYSLTVSVIFNYIYFHFSVVYFLQFFFFKTVQYKKAVVDFYKCAPSLIIHAV